MNGFCFAKRAKSGFKCYNIFMRKSIVTITLNPAIDKTLTVPKFKIGNDFCETSISISAGGKGINVSEVLKHLNIKSITSGFLGGHAGEYIKNALDKKKIEHAFCAIKGNTRTSLTIIDPGLNTITRVLERGPRITNKELNTFRKKIRSLLHYCRYLILSGKNIPGAPDSFYGEIIAAAKIKNIFTILDTSGKAFEIGLKEKPFMIKPNLKETEQMIGEKLNSLSKIKKAAHHLYERGIQIVTITMGSKGAIGFNGKEMIFAIPPKVKRKNPVGCGDAFIGGFLAFHQRGENFSECMKMAVACGTANVLSMNPGSLKPGAVNKTFIKIHLKSTLKP